MARPEGWVGSDLRARAEVVQWLSSHGGIVEDPSGLIVGQMRTDLGKGRALSQLLADMERDGMIKREIRGRRTLMLELVDDWGLLEDIRHGQVVGTWGVSPEPSEMPAIDAEVDLEALAETLLALVLKRAQTQASSGADLERLKEQLAAAKADLAEARAAVAALRSAEDEQRRQADAMRESLAKFQAAVDRKPHRGDVPLREKLRDADRKLLDQLMRSAPTRRG